MLADFRKAVEKARAAGTGLKEFRKDFDAIVDRTGWRYNSHGKTEEERRAWRARIIYTTNMRTSYMAGRYKQLTDPDVLKYRPYWKYVHSGALHPRKLHLSWNGLVLAATDPAWRIMFPPNGWGCGCAIEALSERQLKALGKDGPDPAPDLRAYQDTDPRTGEPETRYPGIDRGWAYNVGEEWLNGVVPPELHKPLEAYGNEIKPAADLPPLPDPVKARAGDLMATGLAPEAYVEAFLKAFQFDGDGGYIRDTLNNPLKNAWLGTNYGTLGDVMNRPAGGLFSALSGQSVGAMNVQAATVIVNGGIASGAGGLGGLLAGLGASNDNRPLSAYREAIAAIESGGRYGALGPVTASGDRAYGRYQVMGANVGPWTEQALGYAMTPSSFLTSPQAQDAVFDKIFGGYLSRYGNANDAASTWFTGRPLSQGASAADILGTTGASYVQKFNTALSQLTDTTGLATDGLGTLGNGLNQFGGLLSSYQPSGGAGGGLLSALGSLFGIGGGTSQLDIARANIAAGTAGLYSFGGYTGPGGVHEPAGVVHKGEVVWSQSVIARAGGVRVVEAMRLGKRGYAKGGVVESLPFAVPASNDNAGSPARPSIAISISLEGAQGDREIEQKSRQAAYAGMKQALDEYDAQFNDKVAAAVDRPRWR
ncbi:phage minor head protein [Martelella sp. AMO21009]